MSESLFIYEYLILAVDLCSIQASSLCNAKETWEQFSCTYLMETFNPMQIRVIEYVPRGLFSTSELGRIAELFRKVCIQYSIETHIVYKWYTLLSLTAWILSIQVQNRFCSSMQRTLHQLLQKAICINPNDWCPHPSPHTTHHHHCFLRSQQKANRDGWTAFGTAFFLCQKS